MAKTEFNNIENALINFSDAVKKDFVQSLIEYKKNGTIDKTFSIDIVFENGVYTLEFNAEDYYKFIEMGRRPGSKFPPPNAIKNWIKKKNIIPRTINGIKPNENQLAFLIGRSIAKNGIAPLPLLSRAIGENINLLSEELSESLIDDIDEQLQKMFEYFAK